MPYQSEKIRIQGTEFDRRIKLTDDDKNLIRFLREEEQISYGQLAKQFKVSKRLIIFTCKPETLEANKKKRAERGGTMAYYDKDKANEVKKEYRKYKQTLFKEGKIFDNKAA
jgi:hypothetical protein